MEPRPEQSWLGVEVRHLAALRAVAEEGTFGAAALSLGYAQSAISQQIAALERHVGHRLFDRPGGSRPVTLTRAGALLLEHAETILSRLAAARIDLDSLGDEEDVTAPLRIGAYQSVAAAILPPVLQEIGVDPCDVGFELRESSDDRELLALLESGELDVAFAELPLQEGPLEASPLLDDPYVLVVPSEHELADLDRAVTLEELATLPLILLKGNSGESRLADAFALHGVAPRVAHRVADGTTLAGLVVAGLGLGLVPRLAAQTEGRALVTLPVESRLPARTIGIAWHRERLRTCTAGLFVDLAVEIAERVGDGAVASS